MKLWSKNHETHCHLFFTHCSGLILMQAMKKFSEGEASAILDPNLEQTEANHLAVEKILELALQCLAPRRHSRPSMRRCAEILWRIRKDHRDLSAPDFRSFSTNSQRSASVREKWNWNQVEIVDKLWAEKRPWILGT